MSDIQDIIDARHEIARQAAVITELHARIPALCAEIDRLTYDNLDLIARVEALALEKALKFRRTSPQSNGKSPV